MRKSGWVVAVAVVILAGQIAMASPGRRRSAVGGTKVEIEGVIKTAASDSLVITSSHKEDVTVMLTDTTVIRHGDTPIAAADLKAGERVHVKATQANDVKTATEIEVQNENENEAENEVSVSGVVKSVGADSLVVTTGGGDVTVNVDAATIIRMKQNAITLADIKVGDRVEAEGTKVDDHTLLAKHIQVEDENESEAEIHGAVKSVGTSSLVVTTATGDVTVNVDSSTVIRKQGVVITLADIKVGDEVEAEGTLADAQTLNATKIQVENPNEIENDDEAEIKGTVKSVGTSSLVVTTSKGDITVMVDSSTEIRRHGDHLALSDIKAGNQVEAEGTMIDPQTLKAKKISVEGGH